MNNWRNVKLGDLVNFRRGYDLPHSEMRGNNFKVVASNGVIGYHSNYTTKAPVITIGRSGNIGTPFYYDEDCWAHNTTLYVDDFKNSYPKFIFYLLKTLNLKKIGGGSAVPTLNRNHIHPLEIYTTIDYNEQKAIAGVLSAFDDKIELNNRIIKNLEEQAQTLYKHWFVDFEFPNENGQPYKSSGGTFKDSELGKIPTDWEVKEIKDVSARLTQRVKSEKNIKVLSAINKGELELSENVFDKKVFSSKIDNYIIVPPKCFAYNPARANIGSIGMNKFDFTGCVSPVYIAIKFKDSYEWFWEYLIKSKIFRQEIIKRSSGTVRQNFDFESFKLIKVIYPNKNDVINFNSIYLTIYENIKKLQHKNEKLAEIRDYLLPKLMNGKIRVKVD